MIALFSLCALIIISASYYKGTDNTAILTNFPQYLWAFILGLPALLAWLIMQSRLGLVTVFLWLVYALATFDGLEALAHTGLRSYKIRNLPALNTWRVFSLDCLGIDQVPLDKIQEYNPDLIFLQGLRNPHELEALYKDHPDNLRILGDCAIICRYGTLKSTWRIPHTPGLIVDWVPQETKLPTRLVNVRLYRRDTMGNVTIPTHWKYNSVLSATHRTQINSIIDTIRTRTMIDGKQPIIMCGSFNVSPGSSIFRPLKDDFKDAFDERGSGYGATAPADAPMLRKDRIFSTAPLSPTQAAAIRIPGANHRGVLADLYRQQVN